MYLLQACRKEPRNLTEHITFDSADGSEGKEPPSKMASYTLHCILIYFIIHFFFIIFIIHIFKQFYTVGYNRQILDFNTKANLRKFISQ